MAGYFGLQLRGGVWATIVGLRAFEAAPMYALIQPEMAWAVEETKHRPVGGVLGGLQEHPQLQWITRQTHRSKQTVIVTVTVYYGKGYRWKPAMELGACDRVQETQAQTPSCPLPAGSCGLHLVLPAMMCDNTPEELSTREAHSSLGVQSFYWRFVSRHGCPPAWLMWISSLSRHQADSTWSHIILLA